jgi:ABC-2 type transport system ATP-binding protein
VSVLEVEALEKTFTRGFLRRRTTALRGISFAVEEGEVFGFLGPNGAGKTTTIKILMGLLFPSGGHAKVLGAPVGDRRAKQRVGYLPENPYFYDYLSLIELLDMVGRLHGLDAATRRRRAADLAERVGLANEARRRLRSYSKGMLQRAGLAQALMGDPDVVVLDEPMGGLDPIGRKEVRDLMLELRDRGKTVFFSTHILSDATLLCDRVGIIVRGTLRDVGPLGELLSPRVHSVDVLWEAPEGAATERLLAFDGDHSHTSEGRVLCSRDPDLTDRFLAAVIEQGGRVLQVTPHRQTLEELFVSEAMGDRAPTAEEAS